MNISGGITLSGGITVTEPPKNLPRLTTAIASKIVTRTPTSFTPVTVSNGIGAVTLSLTPALPSGLTFNTSTGVISGTVLASSAATVYTVRAVDSLGQSATPTTFELTTIAAVTGQQTFTAPGSVVYWTVPAGVTSVSAVCVGGGGGSRDIPQSTAGAGGGGGGGLGWKNNITVVPGDQYLVSVGSPGTQGYGGGRSYFFSRYVVSAEGGAGGETAGFGQLGGTYVGEGGGNGGSGGNASGTINGGSGGAGGYTGAGGRGSDALSNNATAGQGGGGGGGYPAGAGGGVGLLGMGANGSAGTDSNNPAMAGSGGSGTTYGAGGPEGGISGNGAVRIIWPGNLRRFPSTNTGDL